MCLVDVRVKTFHMIQTWGLIVGEKRRPKYSHENQQIALRMFLLQHPLCNDPTNQAAPVSLASDVNQLNLFADSFC